MDEKSQVQALGRSQPAFPMMPGMPEKRTHDYVRNGTTSLFAAFNTADGTVISSLHRRHRSIEFKKFLAKIDAEVPADLAVHLICDNYGTHKTPAIKTWLAAHPRFQMHFTPTYSSWLNQVERFFGFVTEDLLQRSHHNTVQQLEADIRGWIKDWNTHPKPFIGRRPKLRATRERGGFGGTVARPRSARPLEAMPGGCGRAGSVPSRPRPEQRSLRSSCYADSTSSADQTEAAHGHDHHQ